MPIGLPEFVENPENRCPVVLLLDTSGSMEGSPIGELNRGVSVFRDALLADAQASVRVETAIVTFGPVELAQDFATAEFFLQERLEASGNTPLGEAVFYGMELIEARKRIYQANGILYYRPWMFLITDGAPNPDSPWQEAARMVREAEAAKRHTFFAVGVEGADMTTLTVISPAERPPMKLNGLDFKGLFQWLSASLVRVSSSQIGSSELGLPPVGWGTVSL